MLVKIKQPVKGYGYFGGETANLPDEIATKFVVDAYAILVPESEGETNTLPRDLPARELLYENGYESVEQILDARETLTDVKGIGKNTAGKIVLFCESYVED